MYKALGLGKLVGMPMAGTMTAVWWERQEDPTLILGLPEVNCLDMSGQPLENKQLDPDVEVNNTPEQMLSGDDAQLRRAIDLMMQNK
jgi:tricorn protease